MSNIIAIILLIIAISDTLLATYWLPGALTKKCPEMPPASRKMLLTLIHTMTFVFAFAAIAIYWTQFFG